MSFFFQSKNFKLDYRRFSDGFRESMLTSRKDAEAIFRSQTRPMTLELIKMTPPSRGSSRSNSATAKAAGMGTIDRDVRKVFYASKKRKIPKFNMEREVESRRSAKNGRVSRQREMLPARERDIRREVRRRQTKVGYMAAGWVSAALDVGVSPGQIWSWVRRHKAPGYGRISVSSTKLRLKLANRVDYASRIRGMQRRVQLALDIQGNRMIRASAEYWRKKAAKSGFDAR